MEGLALSDEAFVRLMHTYCVLARRETPEVELLEDGCLAREAHMARRIREAGKDHRRILVVAGGFHIAGLLDPKIDPLPTSDPARSPLPMATPTLSPVPTPRLSVITPTPFL